MNGEIILNIKQDISIKEQNITSLRIYFLMLKNKHTMICNVDYSTIES